MSKTQPASVLATPATLGAPYEGGYYAGQITLNGRPHAVVCAGIAGEVKGPWHTTGKRTKGADSYSDSMANTQAMAKAGSALAKQVLALEIDGTTGWCIPARDVLELLYRAFKPTKETNYVFRSGDNPSSLPAGYPYTTKLPGITKVKPFAAKGTEAFADAWYWGSTQFSENYAWYQIFSYGYQDFYHKSFEARCRAVRLIPL